MISNKLSTRSANHGQIYHATVYPRHTKFQLQQYIPLPKTAILNKFPSLGFLYLESLPIRAKFGTYEGTHGIMYNAKFHIYHPHCTLKTKAVEFTS